MWAPGEPGAHTARSTLDEGLSVERQLPSNGAEVVGDQSRTLALMFCATCFQTAEDGSKYCAGCRQAREEKAAGDTAWSVPPEATPAFPATSSVAHSPVRASAEPGWDAGAVWTPPSSVDIKSTVALTPDLAPKLQEVDAPPVPRAQSPELQAADGEQSDNPFSNPFGEPPEEALLPQPKPDDEEAEAPALAIESPPVVVESVTSGLASHDFAIEPLPSRGNKEIVAMLAAGLLLLSVTAVAQVFKDPAESPTVTVAASSTTAAPFPDAREGQAGGEGDTTANLETAQRFLASAQQSMNAGDFELAASQLGKAVQELESAQASESDIATAKLMLAQARIGEGKLLEAQALCVGLQGGPAGAEARQLSQALEKAMLQQAEALLASGTDDLQADRLTPAMQKARDAEKLFSLAGSSPDRARELRRGVERAEASIGLQRPSTNFDQRVSVGQGQDIRAVRPRPTVTYQRPAARPALPPEAGVPQSRPPSRPSQPGGQPATFPMATQMNRRPSQPQVQLPPEQEGGSELPAEAPEQTQPAPPQGQPAAGQPSYEPGKNRAGSEDVLPTYNSRSGGSVY